MILNDELSKYIPSQWTLVHPNGYNLAIAASVKKLAELAIVEKDDNYYRDKYAIYWRRNLDDPQFELGL